jgi:hypothetical protein
MRSWTKFRNEKIPDEGYCLLGCDSMESGESYQCVSDKPAASILRFEEGDSRFLQNFGNFLPNYTVSHLRRQ